MGKKIQWRHETVVCGLAVTLCCTSTTCDTLNCCCWYSSTRYHDSISKHINKCLCIYRPHPISNIRTALNGLQKWPKSPKSKLKIGTAKIILFDFLFYIFINRRLNSSRINFFLFPNPQNSANFSFFFLGRFFCSPFKPGLRRSEATVT